MNKIDNVFPTVDRSSGAASPRTHPLCRSDADRGRIVVGGGTRNQWSCWVGR
jgi:hypothetical protein